MFHHQGTKNTKGFLCFRIAVFQSPSDFLSHLFLAPRSIRKYQGENSECSLGELGVLVVQNRPLAHQFHPMPHLINDL